MKPNRSAGRRIGAEINPAIGPGSVPDKLVSSTNLDASELLFAVAGTNAEPIPDGPLYVARFKVDNATLIGVYPLGSGGGSIAVTTCAGDCDGSGAVSIGEVQRCINIFLGHPLCDASTGGSCPVADVDGDGGVSLSEAQQCVRHFVAGC